MTTKLAQSTEKRSLSIDHKSVDTSSDPCKFCGKRNLITSTVTTPKKAEEPESARNEPKKFNRCIAAIGIGVFATAAIVLVLLLRHNQRNKAERQRALERARVRHDMQKIIPPEYLKPAVVTGDVPAEEMRVKEQSDDAKRDQPSIPVVVPGIFKVSGKQKKSSRVSSVHSAGEPSRPNKPVEVEPIVQPKQKSVSKVEPDVPAEDDTQVKARKYTQDAAKELDEMLRTIEIPSPQMIQNMMSSLQDMYMATKLSSNVAEIVEETDSDEVISEAAETGTDQTPQNENPDASPDVD